MIANPGINVIQALSSGTAEIDWIERSVETEEAAEYILSMPVIPTSKFRVDR